MTLNQYHNRERKLKVGEDGNLFCSKPEFKEKCKNCRFLTLNKKKGYKYDEKFKRKRL